MEILADPEIGLGPVAEERLELHLAVQGLRHEPLPERGPEGRRRGRVRVDRVPVRRLGPDARRGRCRYVLARHDRVDQRSGGPGHRADEHRRQLAGELATWMRGVCGPGDRAAAPLTRSKAREEGGVVLIKIANMILTVLAGIGAALVLLLGASTSSPSCCPGKWEHRVKPYVFILPAFAAISLFLLYPAVQTIVYSFANAGEHRLGRLRQLHQPAHQQRLPADADQHPAVDRGRAGRHDHPRPGGRGARRPAQPAWREAVEDDHLPADGDQRGRRRHGLALRLRVRAARSTPGRPAERDRHGVRRRPDSLARADHAALQHASC